MFSSFNVSVSKYISFCRSNFLTSFFFSYAYGKLTSDPERKAVLNKTLIPYAGFSSPCYYDSFLSRNGNTGSFHSIELFMPEIKHSRSKKFRIWTRKTDVLFRK